MFNLTSATLRNSSKVPRVLCENLTTSNYNRKDKDKDDSIPIHKRKDLLPYSKIPGFANFPFLGSVPFLLKRKDFSYPTMPIFFRNVFNELGPIFRITLPIGRLVVIKEPSAIRNMYQQDPVKYGFPVLQKVRYDNVYFQNKSGVLAESHAEWDRIRTGVQKPLLTVKELRGYLPVMDNISLEFVERISELQKKYGEMPSDFLTEIYKFALENIAYLVFNRRYGCLRGDLHKNSAELHLINTVNEVLATMGECEGMNSIRWKYLGDKTYRRMKKAHDILLEIAEENYRLTNENLGKKIKVDSFDKRELTILEKLIRADELSTLDIVTFALDCLLAAIDTTSHALAFTFYLLAKHPEKQRLLQKEVDQILGDGKGPITTVEVNQMDYLRCCIKESLRLYPIVAGVLRELQEDVDILGYRVPKGVNVLASTVVTDLDAKWFDKHTEYHPERWLKKSKPMGDIPPGASLPFSFGKRMCLGRRIAEQEMYTALARIFHRFNIEYKYGEMETTFRFVVIPESPLKFNFVERRK